MVKKETRIKYGKTQRQKRSRKATDLQYKISECEDRIRKNKVLLKNPEIISVQRNILLTGINNLELEIIQLEDEIKYLRKKYRKRPILYTTIPSKYGEISGPETIALSTLIEITQAKSNYATTIIEQSQVINDAINGLSSHQDETETEIFKTPELSPESSPKSHIDVVPTTTMTIGDALDDLPNDPMFSTLYLIIGRLINITSRCIESVGNVAVQTTKQIFKMLTLMWGYGPVGKIIVIYICSKLYGCNTLHTLVPIRDVVMNLINFMKSNDFMRYVLDVIRDDASKWAGTAASIITNAFLYIINRFDLGTTIRDYFRTILTDAIRENLGTIGNLFNQYVATATANVAADVAAGVASGLAAGATTEAQTIAAGHIVDALVNNQDFQNMFLTNQAATSATTSFVNGMFGALGSAFVPIATSAIGAATHQQTLTNFGGKSTRKLKRKNQTKRRTLY